MLTHERRRFRGAQKVRSALARRGLLRLAVVVDVDLTPDAVDHARKEMHSPAVAIADLCQTSAPRLVRTEAVALAARRAADLDEVEIAIAVRVREERRIRLLIERGRRVKSYRRADRRS